jgi:hyperosmotically inducible protein
MSRLRYQINLNETTGTNMKSLSVLLLSVGLAAVGGCDAKAPATDSTATTATSANDPAMRDNSEVNVRDRDDATKTPLDQNENQKDIDITARIRKSVVGTEMSVNAQNVKIITQDGKVTLRGPVASSQEKAQIDKLAVEAVGRGNVDNQLEIQP